MAVDQGELLYSSSIVSEAVQRVRRRTETKDEGFMHCLHVSKPADHALLAVSACLVALVMFV